MPSILASLVCAFDVEALQGVVEGMCNVSPPVRSSAPVLRELLELTDDDLRNSQKGRQPVSSRQAKRCEGQLERKFCPAAVLAPPRQPHRGTERVSGVSGQLGAILTERRPPLSTFQTCSRSAVLESIEVTPSVSPVRPREDLRCVECCLAFPQRDEQTRSHPEREHHRGW